MCSLLSDGMSMMPYARELLDSYRRVQEQAAGLSGVTSGLIRIGTFSSVATHWMPNIIRAFQEDYPEIRYEMLLGDYEEIEQWIFEGRVECGFLRLPTRPEFDTISLEKDELVVVMPKEHPFREKQVVDITDLNGQPFMLLEHGGKTEVSELLDRYGVRPDIRFTTWDDYAILSMIEQGLGIGIMHRMILQRIQYEVEIRSLREPAYREIGLVMRSRKSTSAAAKKFVEYLKYR